MCFSLVVASVVAKVLLYPRVTSVLVSEPPSGEAVVKLVWYVIFTDLHQIQLFLERSIKTDNKVLGSLDSYILPAVRTELIRKDSNLERAINM